MEKREKAIVGVGLGIAGVGVLLLAVKAKAAPPVPPPPGFAHLSGQVTDANTGYPLQGVKVTLDGEVYNTDAEGSYVFFDLVPGKDTLTFEKSDYETESFSIVLIEGLNELNVELVPIAPPPELTNVYGKVIDREGNPLLGVLVTLDGYSTYTGSDGYFSFYDLTPGYYTITFEKEGYITLTDSGEIPAGDYEIGTYSLSRVTPTPTVALFIERAIAHYNTDAVSAMQAVMSGGEYGYRYDLSIQSAAELMWHSLQGRNGNRRSQAQVQLNVAAGYGYMYDGKEPTGYWGGHSYLPYGLGLPSWMEVGHPALP